MKFKIGDTVRVIARPCRWFDHVGTVADTAANQFHVAGLEDAPLWFHPNELILAEHPNDSKKEH
jgi:uncharacterized protein YodC (DUF2158 family)